MAIATYASLLIVCLIIGELGSRAWLRFGARTYIWRPHSDFVLESNPDVLPHLSPRTHFRTNGFGARGDKTIGDAQTFKVVNCGGSAVECFTLDEEESWQAVAQSALNRPENLGRLGANKAQIWGIGKSGMTVDSLCYALPRVLPQFGKIDVLTVMIGMSAVNYWVQLGTPSKLPPPPEPWADIFWHSEKAYGWRPRETGAAEVLRRLRNWVKPPATKILKATGRGLARSRLLRANAKSLRESFGDPTAWITAYEDALVRTVELSRAHARRIVLIRQPTYDVVSPPPEEAAMLWHGFVGTDAGEFCEDYFSHAALCELLRLVDAATVRAGVRSGADVITPADAIKASASTYYDHCHFTPAGARLMGEYLAQSLVDLEAAGDLSQRAQASGRAAPLGRGRHENLAARNFVDWPEDVDRLDSRGLVDRMNSKVFSGVGRGDPA